MDLYIDDGNPSSGHTNEVVGFAGAYDTNYAASYYPWVKILDTNVNKIVSVPPSVVLPAVYAQSDRASAEWFAPAGLNRGGIVQAVQVTDRTTHSERDTLYDAKVNPIAAFPGTGIAVWGQKTLQDAASALDRVNVRRLLINLKKFVSSVSKYLVFEQNVASTRNRFLSIVNPYMESVQQRSGLYAFFVKMDDENNTPDIIDRNILYGQIYIKPAKAAEFIVIDFNILPSSGASFSGI
jgi:phage tail sheath protein FI